MRIRQAVRRLVLAAVVVAAASVAGWADAPGQTQAQTQPQSQTQAMPIAVLAAVEGPIGPGMVRHVEKVVDAARERHAEVLILRLNTPGGLADSMRDIITEVLSSPVPVVGYVAPSGAHAASAGTYILYATHIAAMAPGTNLGAATPVQIGGIPGVPKPPESKPSGQKSSGDTVPAEDTMRTKIMNDAIALIRGLAEMHGRNAEWAEKAVRQAASLSSRQALDMHVIDLVADNLDDLLGAIDGRTVKVDGKAITLHTKNAVVETVEPDVVTRLLSHLSNPNIAFMLLIAGALGLVFEFTHPGTFAPGTVGVICLLLGLYGLNQLPLDYAGLALVLVGIGLMVAEALTAGFGVLGLGGIVAFVLGASFLVNTDVPAFQLSWWVIGGTAAVCGVLLILLLGYVWRVYRKPRHHKATDILGVEGQVMDWSGERGHVWAHSERWSARGAAGLISGEAVRVHDIDGLTLIVDRADSGGSANETEHVHGGE